ncbi:MAG: Ig-like domain-containing protein [Gemmatimonadota bacterium]|nr:MAG: Ig-like domain-containing protein [Gemmatimonadota bacterium]
MHRRHVLSTLVTAVMLSMASSLAAQFPQATADQRAAGDRVTNARLDVEELVIPRGSTASVSAVLLDEDGTEVSGALAIVMMRSRIVQVSNAVVGDGPIQFTGQTPGQAEVRIIVMVSGDESAFRGARGTREVSRLPIRVLDWPAAEIEIDDLAYFPYVGTSQTLSGRVITDHGNEHATAAIRWTSADPSVVSVTEGGILTPLSGGSTRVTAHTENGVTAQITVDAADNPVRSISISPNSTSTRTGDVVTFEIEARDSRGNSVNDAAVDLAATGLDRRGSRGLIFRDGTFVAENAGAYRVVASIGGVAAAAVVEVAGREQAETVERVDHAAVSYVATSDLWAFEGQDGRDYVYTGTHARGGGQRMFAWDVTDPANVQLMDSVVVNARVVNDVKVSDDAAWAIITREGASTRRNGIVVLDLTDPAHPTVLSELTDSLTAGIHNVWIMGDVVYAVNDGTNAVSIIDMSDPTNPRYAGRWEIRPGEVDKSLHDVWAEDGYAYLSYWDDGLVILDVGAGTHGGTPTEPTFVSQISYPQGNTHVAIRDRDYVFVGDEIGTSDGMRGYIHVIDVADIENPTEVAKYEVPEAGAHNVWIDDETLYIAYYQGGLRIVDISGTLRGDLYRQGREIGMYRTGAPEGKAVVPNSPMAWGPQVFKDNVFVSDMNSGLWVLKQTRPRRVAF